MSDGCDSPYFTLKLWCDSPIFTFRLGCDSPLFTLKRGCDSPSRKESPDDVLHWKECDSPLKGSSIEICNELIECTALITPPPPSASHRPTPHPAHTVVCCCVMQNYHQFCVMVDQSREMNVEESMAKRQWSTDDFNQVLGTHTEMVCCDVWNGLMVCCDVWNGLLWCVKWYVVMCEMVCCEVWNGMLWGVKLSVVMCKMVCCEVWNGLLWGVKWSVVGCEVVCCGVWNCCDV